MKRDDWVIVKQPKLWLSNTDRKTKDACINTVSLTNDETTNSLETVDTVPRQDKTMKRISNVHSKTNQGCERSRQFITSKRMQKLLKGGEPIYLALVRPVN